MRSIKELYEAWKEGSISAADHKALLELLSLPENEAESRRILREMIEEAQFAGGTARLSPDRLEVLRSSIVSVDREMETRDIETPSRPIRPLYRWRRMAVAAAVVLFVAAGAYYLLHRKPVQHMAAATLKDISPASNKATLKLADGSTVTLDSAGRQVLQQGGATVQQSGGQIVYVVKNNNEPLRYNTLTTPRGGQFKVKLPDGTDVWLNAASSLRYPTVFSGGERRVEVTGEAYFEVASLAEKPFRVSVNGQTEIEVLGTHFNVNAYLNERSLQTTLLEGSVRVKQGNEKIILQPGQQARVGQQDNTTQQLTLVKDPDIEKVMAWRHGVFNFDGATLEEVMKQLERWYDIDIVYEKGIPDIRFGGELNKNINLQDLLVILEKTEVHFRLEGGRKLIVTK
ncbi:FecR family protein [Chitinophaga sp. S165]|uniref:FecR family protein n=1 Tax=Chitinophaga sp. S165 TaxID=2135462 RepID=UPI000D70E70C|nr:FecR family protein [Chitinophaga sp. S165]PWV45404.1 FecR family protein [Chitinophaga sp. S165]